MSQPARRVIPPRPSLARAIREAAVDLYYHLVRLVVANVVWGASVLVVGVLAAGSILAFPLAVILVPLTAGLMAMATELVRNRSVVLSDFVDGIRRRFWRHLGLGVAQLVVMLVAGTNLLVGAQTPGFVGPVLVATAFYTLLGVWILAVSTWPLLLDPVRAEESALHTLRVGGTLILAHPIRIGGLALLLAVFFIASTVFAAALVSVSGALGFLVAAHYVLPSADRLEGRATLELPED